MKFANNTVFANVGRRGLLAIVLLALLAVTAGAHDYVPGGPQSQPILLKGGTLYTISGGVLPETDLLFEDGRITQIATEIEPGPDTKVIDVAGKNVYPGLIAGLTTIGLTEIGSVRATNDVREIGLDNAEITAFTAYNWDSEIIPTVRANGITTALIVPGGRLIKGRSSLINLDGWTTEDAAEELEVGLHLQWPRSSIITAWWMEESAEEQKKNQAEERARLRSIFDDARAYHLARKADSSLPRDIRWDGLGPVFAGEMRIFIHADDYRQIEQAVAFALEYGFEMVLVGGREAWKAADLLQQNDIPVILGPTQNLPMRADDDYDLAFKIPRLLHESGVRFCFSSGQRSWSARNLPLQAGQAVAYGLPSEVALRAVTLTTAEILGVDDRLGSIEVGKKATLVVSEGDLLDPLTHRVVLEFIEGREVNLDSKQKELYRKYRTR